jgi:hypothetical protein
MKWKWYRFGPKLSRIGNLKSQIPVLISMARDVFAIFLAYEAIALDRRTSSYVVANEIETVPIWVPKLNRIEV